MVIGTANTLSYKNDQDQMRTKNCISIQKIIRSWSLTLHLYMWVS